MYFYSPGVYYFDITFITINNRIYLPNKDTVVIFSKYIYIHLKLKLSCLKHLMIRPRYKNYNFTPSFSQSKMPH